jgi:hypothetical protein
VQAKTKQKFSAGGHGMIGWWAQFGASPEGDPQHPSQTQSTGSFLPAGFGRRSGLPFASFHAMRRLDGREETAVQVLNGELNNVVRYALRVTPAKEAGLSDHVSRVKELAGVIDTTALALTA